MEPKVIGTPLTPIPTNNNWDVRVISRSHVDEIFDGGVSWLARPGFVFVDIGLRVHRPPTSEYRAAFGSMILAQGDDGTQRRPDCMSGMPAAPGPDIDPLKIVPMDCSKIPVGAFNWSREFVVELESDTYLRLVFTVPSSSTIRLDFQGLRFVIAR